MDSQVSSCTALPCFRRIVSLKNSRAFQNILQNSKTLRIRSRTVDLFLELNVQDYRLGLIVSKRCYKRAVDRNRAKRLFREYVRLNLRSYPPLLLVIRLKQPLESLTFAPIATLLDSLLLKAFPQPDPRDKT